jgi:amidohydrolase
LLGLEVRTGIAGTGVTGTLYGNADGKTILLRADMDALEINENTDLEYSSKEEGLMHACGHDVHVTWLIGAARILTEMREELNGNVIFLFQPAEETTGGALPMIMEGVLDHPSVHAAIAAHVDPSEANKSGMVALKYGAMCAAPDNFIIRLMGPGGHNSTPHLVPDPIDVGCQIYSALKSIVERETDPLEPVILHVGSFNSGSSHNTIPDFAELTGTVRSLSQKTRDFMEARMVETVEAISASRRIKYEFEYERLYPPMINDKYITDIVRNAASSLLGEEKVIILEKPEMAAEDFSYFLEKVPGTYINIGTYNPDMEAVYPLHSSKFAVDESIIRTGAAVLSASVLEYLNEKII